MNWLVGFGLFGMLVMYHGFGVKVFFKIMLLLLITAFYFFVFNSLAAFCLSWITMILLFTLRE